MDRRISKSEVVLSIHPCSQKDIRRCTSHTTVGTVTVEIKPAKSVHLPWSSRYQISSQILGKTTSGVQESNSSGRPLRNALLPNSHSSKPRKAVSETNNPCHNSERSIASHSRCHSGRTENRPNFTLRKHKSHEEFAMWRLCPVAQPNEDSNVSQLVHVRSTVTRSPYGETIKKFASIQQHCQPPIQTVLDKLHFIQTECINNDTATEVLTDVIKILTSMDLYKGVSSLPECESETSKDIFRFYAAPTLATTSKSSCVRRKKHDLPEVIHLDISPTPDPNPVKVRDRSPSFQEFLSSQGPTRRPSMPMGSQGLDDEMAQVCEWSTFDIFQIETSTGRGRVLRCVGMEIMRQYKLSEILRLPPNKADELLYRWLGVIEDNYHNEKNAYHNSTHAADVMQAMAYLIKLPEISCLLKELNGAAALIAAAIHDCDHPGRNAQFLVNTRHPLALLYNDKAVLENHHVSLAWRLTTQNEECNIFAYLKPSEFAQMRKSVLSMVISTDMSEHFHNVQLFKQVLPNIISGDIDSRSPQQIDSSEMLLKTLIKAADISNPARPWQQCNVWADRIIEEYAQQTDEEQKLNLPISLAKFERGKCNKPETQHAFIMHFVLELFQSLAELCPTPFGLPTGPLYHLRQNFERWEAMMSQSCSPRSDLAVSECPTSASTTASDTVPEQSL